MAGGHIINEYIIINCTSPDIDPYNKSIHFLTNVGRHHKCMKDVISDHVDHVYTSEFNVWYLTTFFHANSSKFVAVPMHRKKHVKCRGKRITFEFLDASHCAGSVMILFKGDFGTYLYTGNCRYTSEMLDYKSLKPYTKGNKELERLYINGAFKKLGYNFPPKPVVIKQIFDFIRNRKEETIYICCRQLGKEDILASLAKQLNEVVCVSPEKLKILKKLGYSLSLFTTELAGTRIRVLPPSEVTWLKMKRRRDKEKCCAIVMSGCVSRSEREAMNGIFKFPASDHSSAGETQAMIEKIAARAVLFLNAGVTRPRPTRSRTTKAVETLGSNCSGSTEEHIVRFDISNLPLAVIPPPPPAADPLPEQIAIVPPPPPQDPPHSPSPKVIVEKIESSESSIRFDLDSSYDSCGIDLWQPSCDIIGPSLDIVPISTTEGSNTDNIIIPETLSIGLEYIPESSSNFPEEGTSSILDIRQSPVSTAEENVHHSLAADSSQNRYDSPGERSCTNRSQREKTNRKYLPRIYPLNCRAGTSSSGFENSLSTIHEESRVTSSSESSKQISVNDTSQISTG